MGRAPYKPPSGAHAKHHTFAKPFMYSWQRAKTATDDSRLRQHAVELYELLAKKFPPKKDERLLKIAEEIYDILEKKCPLSMKPLKKEQWEMEQRRSPLSRTLRQ